jgi:hypothetical protein
VGFALGPVLVVERPGARRRVRAQNAHW